TGYPFALNPMTRRTLSALVMPLLPRSHAIVGHGAVDYQVPDYLLLGGSPARMDGTTLCSAWLKRAPSPAPAGGIAHAVARCWMPGTGRSRRVAEGGRSADTTEAPPTPKTWLPDPTRTRRRNAERDGADMDELPIGRRVAHWRGRRNMSQQVL